MRAAVLDFDGVIAKSMEQHAEAYRQVLGPLGVDVSDAAVFEREGARSESIIADLLGTDADTPQVAELSAEKQAAYLALGRPACYDGAASFVRAVRDAVPRLGLVTGTRRENLDLLIPDLLPLFDAVLAQDAYRHDKPHPEPYAKAATALGARPAACVAVENAPRGVQSAKAAGYGRVIGLCTTMPAHRLREAGADAVAADHDAALEAVREALALLR